MPGPRAHTLSPSLKSVRHPTADLPPTPPHPAGPPIESCLQVHRTMPPRPLLSVATRLPPWCDISGPSSPSPRLLKLRSAPPPWVIALGHCHHLRSPPPWARAATALSLCRFWPPRSACLSLGRRRLLELEPPPRAATTWHPCDQHLCRTVLVCLSCHREKPPHCRHHSPPPPHYRSRSLAAAFFGLHRGCLQRGCSLCCVVS
jgi:hypothetical protein